MPNPTLHYIVLYMMTLILNPISAYPLTTRSTSYTGDGTYYTVGLGSCGETNADTDLVVALSEELMDGGKSCGKQIKITTPSGSVTATVVDTCPGCDQGSVDLSIAAFKKIGDIDAGRISIKWSFL
ncbi:RlpA-like double-psi beta-barrel-protein domain-containing protein-containing protein [Chlamydoabsidia padenii]|nr:RlpA-like double-psi beta-barrel-protein domain-containing protein-containing protein [Chlamydoabsidia padenii]